MKNHPIILILVLFALFANSCKYDFILPEEVAPPIDNGGAAISFATQIAPIFSAGDKCTSCHKSGGQTPDLSAANAYSQISTKYVKTASPETSQIYTEAAPSTAVHTWKKYTSNEAALLLAWIKEGAKNN
jgi:hypothetical protein